MIATGPDMGHETLGGRHRTTWLRTWGVRSSNLFGRAS